MVNNPDQENENLQRQLESREAGVIELLELYARVEPAYTAAIQALDEHRTVTASDTTNPR